MAIYYRAGYRLLPPFPLAPAQIYADQRSRNVSWTRERRQPNISERKQRIGLDIMFKRSKSNGM